MLLYVWNIHIHKEGKYNCNLSLCLFSSSNCTGRGRGWPCCVPNYLRTFPKIATETSLHVRLSRFHSARVFKYVSDSNLLFFPSHTLPLLQLFFFPLLKSFLTSFSVILSLFLYVSYPLLLSFWLPLQMMPRGSFWKAQMTTSMQITSMWVCSSSFFISPSISLCLVGGLFY